MRKVYAWNATYRQSVLMLFAITDWSLANDLQLLKSIAIQRFWTWKTAAAKANPFRLFPPLFRLNNWYPSSFLSCLYPLLNPGIFKWISKMLALIRVQQPGIRPKAIQRRRYPSQQTKASEHTELLNTLARDASYIIPTKSLNLDLGDSDCR